MYSSPPIYFHLDKICKILYYCVSTVIQLFGKRCNNGMEA